MKTAAQLKTATPPILITLALACFAFLSPARAVVPAPDGGYPGGNTAEGQAALLSLTTGGFNTAVGYFSLRSDSTGSFNTAIGAGTLFANTADLNTATGTGALFSNTTGSDNTADGGFALFSNTTGYSNAATGATALFSNTDGHQNTALGTSALYHNISGSANTAAGINALSGNTIGAANTAVGASALTSNVGGNSNTAIGEGTLAGNTSGSLNVALGDSAGSNLTTGDNNIDIGYNVVGLAGENNTIRIGNTDITTTIIRGISGQTIASGSPVLVAANGQLGTGISSKRFKDEIKPMDKASEALFSLKPVTFHYKKEIDPAGTSQFGLVAEDVEKVNPDLVVRDEEGKAYSVRYDQVNVMLLNEFLKEHKAFRKEQQKVQELEKAMGTLTATVNEQAAQLRRVSAQIQMDHSAARVVVSSH